MRPVHGYASARHYLDHLAPIWVGLDPEERGTFWVTTRALGLYAATRHGIDCAINRTLPNPARTRLDGHQPHVLVASSNDAATIGNHRRAVLVEHGAGQTYAGDPSNLRAAASSGYAGGTERRMVDLFLTPNVTVRDRNRARYPNAAHAAVGCPRLDRWHGWTPGPVDERRPTVTFHWPCKLVPETNTAWPHYRAWFEAEPRLTAHGQIIGHAHPRHAAHLSRWWPTVGAEWVPDLDTALEHALVLVADNTSAIWEAAAIGIPVVLLNAPTYRRDVEHGLRFWQYADVGPQVDHPHELEDAVLDAHHPRYRVRRGQATRAIYGSVDGQAAARAVAAMRRHLP